MVDTTVTQQSSRFASAHVTGGILFQGNVSGGLTINSAAAGRADYVGHYSHASLATVSTFVPRPALREQIEQHLRNALDEHNGGTMVLAVWGLGGAGKTQLVLDYLQHHRADYAGTFWIHAGQKNTVERDFMNIYKLLFGERASVAQAPVAVEDAVLAVKSWFSSRQDRWLFVFDSADAIDVETESGYVDLRRYIPQGPRLEAIITTRNRHGTGLARSHVHVEEMSGDEAVELFYKSSQIARASDTAAAVQAIVDELGCLALAVHLAGTYVSQTPRLQSHIQSYLPEYQQRRRELLSQTPESLVHQYSESVLTTWETSFEAVRARCGEASRLLTLLSFLSPDDLFLDLFGIDSQSTLRPDEDRTTWSMLISPEKGLRIPDLEDYLSELARYSLVRWKQDQGCYAMHKLVHTWGWERLDAAEQQDYGISSLQLVCNAIRQCEPTPQAKLRLLTHAVASFTTMTRPTQMLDSQADLDVVGWVEELGHFADGTGQRSETYTFKAFAYKQRKAMLGDDHPNTLSAMNNLANTLGDQGKIDEAAAMQSEVLEKRRRILGNDHPDTLSAMNNLAATLYELGQLGQALNIMKVVLEKRQHILGKDHQYTTQAKNNLAILKQAEAKARQSVEKGKSLRFCCFG